MKTQKSLIDLVPDIVQQFERLRDQMQFELELYKMHEGQIKKKVEESLKAEMFSTSAYNRAIQRIPSINIPKKVTDKLSKVYAQAPIRFANKSLDLIEEFADMLHLNAKMGHSNKASNLNRRCAIEPYVEDHKQMVRVLNAHQFFVFSDSPTSPNKMTVFCKLLGREEKHIQRTTDQHGRRVTNEDDIVLVDIIALYSDTEILVIDSGGTIREDKMQQMKLPRKNPFGVIPFVYINTSETELIPFPNQTAFDMAILIPKLLTDLNYSAQFLSHSVIWTRNTNLTGAEINPDAIVDLGDTEVDGGVPEMGTIEPKTDIDGVLKLTVFELSAYMSTEGLKSGSVGQVEASGASSGIAKIIDESDATEARKSQTELFRMVEPEFWHKFSKMQDVWSKSGIVKKKETFDPDFEDTFSIKFAEIKPLESEKEKYEKMKVAREMKLITKRQALKEIYPNLPSDQLDKRLKELEEELKEEKDEMMSMGLTPGFSQLDRQQEGVSDEKLIEKAGDGGAETK